MLRQALVDAENAVLRTNVEKEEGEGEHLLLIQNHHRQQPQQQQQEQQQQHLIHQTTGGTTTTRTINEHVPFRSLLQQQQEERKSNRGSLFLDYGATQMTTPSITSEGLTELQGSSVQSSSYIGDEEDYDDDDDDEKTLDDDDDGEEEEEEEVITSLLERIWRGMKTFVRVVANVENLWDSPPQHHTSTTTTSYSYYIQQQESIRNRRRNQYVVLFWFVVLASSYAGERSTFKLLVDRAGPFRLFSIQIITVSHMILLGCGLLISYYMKIHQQQQQQHRPVDGPIFMPLGIPVVDCILMAVLDTTTLILVFLTGAHVPPTLTVILVQFTIPLTAFLTQLIHPDGKLQCCRKYQQQNTTPTTQTNNNNNNNENEDAPAEQSPIMVREDLSFAKDSTTYHNNQAHSFGNQQTENGGRTVPAPPSIQLPPTNNQYDERLPGWGGLAAAHVWGSLILFVAVSLALCPAVYSIMNPDFFIYADAIPTRTAINTLCFVFSCFPAAASQLYKEHIFLQYRQPVNVGYLNLILSIFQFILVSVISPVAYGLQGLGFRGDWMKLYPASGTSNNFLDGLKCFFGLLDQDDQENKYPEDAECDLTLLLALLYVFSIIAVGVSVDKIVNAGATKVMYRGISAGIIVAVLSMHYYDMHITDFSYGPAIDAINLVCLLLLVVGAEVYHRSSLQESSFETIYPEVLMPTFDD